MTASTRISSVVLSRYAAALMDLAEKAKSVAKVQKDLQELASMIAASPDLAHVIASPLVAQEKQAAIMAEIATKAKLQDLTKNFLGVLVENRRINALSGIIETYNRIVSLRSGEVFVRVETAEKLTATQEKAVQKKIASVVGSNVSIDAVISPEILGGMIVTIGSYMVDDSVRRKLERLGVALKQTSNQNNIKQSQNLKEVI